MAVPEDSIIRGLYAAGVDAVVSVADGIDNWDTLACGHWSAKETARHLLAVAGWYHSWLDRAIKGHSSQPFSNRELDDQNERELLGLAAISGPEAIDRFEASANSYLERLTDDMWDIPYGYPFGTATAGLHAGAAATEWHLHAWDLARSAEADHVPNDPSALFRAVGWCRIDSAGGQGSGLVRSLRGVVVDAASLIMPWPNLLRLSGR